MDDGEQRILTVSVVFRLACDYDQIEDFCKVSSYNFHLLYKLLLLLKQKQIDEY